MGVGDSGGGGVAAVGGGACEGYPAVQVRVLRRRSFEEAVDPRPRPRTPSGGWRSWLLLRVTCSYNTPVLLISGGIVNCGRPDVLPPCATG